MFVSPSDLFSLSLFSVIYLSLSSYLAYIHSVDLIGEDMQHLLFPAFLVSIVSAQYYTNLTNYAVIASTTITSAGGNTLIVGDVSISPGTSITGFVQNQTVIGTIYINDQQAQTTRQSLNAAFDTLSNLTADQMLPASDLSTLTLNPGVYRFSTAAISLNGNLTLSGTGLFVFQINTAFLAGQNCNIILRNGTVASQVYFLVGTSITIGTGCIINGMMLATQSITVDGARVYGGLYARYAAVTITQSSTITAIIATSFTVAPGVTTSGSPYASTTAYSSSSNPYITHVCLFLMGFLAIIVDAIDL